MTKRQLEKRLQAEWRLFNKAMHRFETERAKIVAEEQSIKEREEERERAKRQRLIDREERRRYSQEALWKGR